MRNTSGCVIHAEGVRRQQSHLFRQHYYQRLVNNDPTVGRNRNQVVVEMELEPGTDYGYFVEIPPLANGGSLVYAAINC